MDIKELLENLDGYGLVITDDGLIDERLDEIQHMLVGNVINPEAVPDLLAACKTALAGRSDWHPMCMDTVEVLRQAITKAEATPPSTRCT